MKPCWRVMPDRRRCTLPYGHDDECGPKTYCGQRYMAEDFPFVVRYCNKAIGHEDDHGMKVKNATR